MGDEADAAEADAMSDPNYDFGSPLYAGYHGDDKPQPRSFINPRGLSRNAQKFEDAQMRLAMMPEIRVNRGGIKFPVVRTPLWQIKQEGQRMRNTEDILAEAQSMRDEAARLEAIAEQREKLGADPFKNGTVLKIDMRYRTGSRSYAYACVKVGSKFYLTGRMGSGMEVDTATGGMTWDNFVAWLSQGDATVWQAKSLKQVL